MPGPADDLPPVNALQIAELFDRHAAPLALYAAQWTNQADDCVQEALLELARQPTAPAHAAAWLYRVVRNKALNAARAARRRSAHEQRAMGARSARSGSGAEAHAELRDSLATLDDDAREIVVLRVWGQLSWQEIAEVIGGSKSAAQRDYIQALQRLRKLWDPLPPTTDFRETKPCPTN